LEVYNYEVNDNFNDNFLTVEPPHSDQTQKDVQEL